MQGGQLTVDIALRNGIRVHQGDMSHPRADQHFRRHGTHAAETDHQHPGHRQSGEPFGAENQLGALLPGTGHQ